MGFIIPKKLIIAGVLFIIVGFGFISYMNSLATKHTTQDKSPVEDAKVINNKFVHGFFTYVTQPLRYKQIEAIMTTRGFHDTFPSGSEIPKEGATKISSSLKIFTAYENTVSQTEKRFLNEILSTTTFNGVSSDSKMIIKTTLVLVKGEGWKVDAVENVSEISQ